MKKYNKKLMEEEDEEKKKRRMMKHRFLPVYDKKNNKYQEQVHITNQLAEDIAVTIDSDKVDLFGLVRLGDGVIGLLNSDDNLSIGGIREGVI